MTGPSPEQVNAVLLWVSRLSEAPSYIPPCNGVHAVLQWVASVVWLPWPAYSPTQRGPVWVRQAGRQVPWEEALGVNVIHIRHDSKEHTFFYLWKMPRFQLSRHIINCIRLCIKGVLTCLCLWVFQIFGTVIIDLWSRIHVILKPANQPFVFCRLFVQQL